MKAVGAEKKDQRIDVLVVGAGPAGAVAARGLAANDVRVLLVDQARFPRWKVCGCCLNGAAMRSLEEMGLIGLPARLGAQRLTHVRFATRGNEAKVALPDGVAVSRVRFDQALIAEAVAAGVEFQPRTTAKWMGEIGDRAHVALTSEGVVNRVQASVVIGADGLAAGFTRQIPGVRTVSTWRARIGAGTTIDTAPRTYDRNVIHMAVGSGGYVGLVRVEDDRLNVAAAFDVSFVQAMGGLPHAASRVLRESGLPAIEALLHAQWQGTPPLTRRHQPPPCGRLFLVGDAAEYVEPFTGEGMAWALAGGSAIPEYVVAALSDASSNARADWDRHARAMLSRRKRRCRWIAGVLRRPRLTGLGVRLLNACPNLAGPYLRKLNRPSLGRG